MNGEIPIRRREQPLMDIPSVGQLVVLEFTDEEGRIWRAGANITTLRLAGEGATPEGRKQLREDDGLKLSGFKVVI